MNLIEFGFAAVWLCSHPRAIEIGWNMSRKPHEDSLRCPEPFIDTTIYFQSTLQPRELPWDQRTQGKDHRVWVSHGFAERADARFMLWFSDIFHWLLFELQSQVFLTVQNWWIKDCFHFFVKLRDFARLFTVGHSNHPPEVFLKLLQKWNIKELFYLDGFCAKY